MAFHPMANGKVSFIKKVSIIDSFEMSYNLKHLISKYKFYKILFVSQHWHQKGIWSENTILYVKIKIYDYIYDVTSKM